MAPKIGKVLAKLFNFIHPNPNLSPEEMCHGVATGLITSCGHLPVLKELIAKLWLSTNRKGAAVTNYEEHKMIYEPQQIDEDEIDLFMTKVYDMPGHRLKLASDEIWNHDFESWGCYKRYKMNTPELRILLDRDTNGPNDIFVAPCA
jgi:hypothetical protein